MFVLIVEVATIIFGFFYIQFGAGGDKDNVAPTQQPIIFVSDQNRASAAAKHLVTTTSRSGGDVAMHIDVYGNGKIKYHANKNVRSKQPIIEVNFGDRAKTTKAQSEKLNEIFKYLNQKYNYKQYDAIGYGAGCLAVYDNAVTYGTKQNKMGLSHFISIAGPYQGVMPIRVPADNQRNIPRSGPHHNLAHHQDIIRQQSIAQQQNINQRFPSYKELKAKSKNLDSNTRVLNIYGVLGEHDLSDGRVSEASASSLKGLVKSDNYQALRLTGPDAEHARILDNQIAERLVNRFLFSE
ncbi:hypothetical protein IV52_GL001004 [Fructilactobacillus lindneri DSM 20690 = JCM 11027]|uniref:Alpha/beta hydrolase n=1 Tax=Fructilactobacillus lindneri DSM 20690 = JCM 11027 TaxID=1122148 RepID=A0A0R2JVX0_9LACO|nr:hypothetical protein IV52_GL001004 [Fructilactobacillus lindneri DSM 20690 = JCM 11027]